MTSPEQIEANRRNAALSTGPRTPAGKAASCLNASRHGLLARELLVKGESKGDFAAFADGVRERLAPDGELEIFVVNRVISAAGDRWDGYAALSAPADKNLDQLALPAPDAKEESQQKTDEIGFVSQNYINPWDRREGL